MVAAWKSCFDESTDGAQEVDYVVGGLICDKRQWKRFYEAWASVLGAAPSIPFYSSKDGGRRDVPGTVFHGWTDRQVQAKRVQLARVVHACAGRMYLCGLNCSDFWTIATREPSLPEKWQDPYLPLFCMGLQCAAYYMAEQAPKYGTALRKPAIVFDTLSSPRSKARALAIYDEYASATGDNPAADIAKWLPDTLQFKDDRSEEPGLQAADLIAHTFRNARERRREARAESPVLAALGDNLQGIILDELQLASWKRGLMTLLERKRERRLDA